MMVFGDLSIVLAASGTIFEMPTQGRALTSAALTVIKLMTIRLEKGAPVIDTATVTGAAVDVTTKDDLAISQIGAFMRRAPGQAHRPPAPAVAPPNLRPGSRRRPRGRP